MRITCPFCGPRDRREFYYYGADAYLKRPGESAAPEAWDDYLHLRDNPAGWTKDLWYHDLGCSAWIEVERDTRTHEIRATRLIAGPGDGASLDAGPAGGPKPARAPRAAARDATEGAQGAGTVASAAEAGAVKSTPAKPNAAKPKPARPAAGATKTAAARKAAARPAAASPRRKSGAKPGEKSE